MLLGMPVANLEVRHLFARRVSVAVGVTPDAGQVLAGGVVMELWIASPDAHCLSVSLRESPVVISARH